MSTGHAAAGAGHATTGRQDGFALIGALFVVIGIAGVALIALMTMTLSSSKISVTQNATSREVRAADNALDSAINLMRMDPDGVLGSSTTASIRPLDYASNARVVTVTATCEASPQVIRTDTVTADAPALQLVGPNGYQSGRFLRRHRGLAQRLPAGQPGAGVLCALVARDRLLQLHTHAPTEFAAAAPSLIHVADDDPADLPKTLFVAADLLARRGSATMIPPSGVSPRSRSPAATSRPTSGCSHRRGRWLAGSAPPGTPGTWSRPRSSTPTTPWAFPTAGGRHRRRCAGRAGRAGSPPGFGDTFTAFAPTPTCRAGSGSVVELAPGAYGKAQTAALNQLLGGTCPNRTFWFKPDQCRPPPGLLVRCRRPRPTQARDEWNSLIISDPTVRVIFGTPAGGFRLGRSVGDVPGRM